MPEDNNNMPAMEEDAIQPESGTGDSETGTGAADDFLSAFRSQISAAQERHGDILSNMQSHLGTLCGDVDEIRRRIPEDLPGKIAGLESGLENLNDRVMQMAGSVSDNRVNNDQTSAHSTGVAPQTDDTVADDLDFDVVHDSDHHQDGPSHEAEAVSSADDDLIADEAHDVEAEEGVAAGHASDQETDQQDDDQDAHASAPAALKSATYDAAANGEHAEVRKPHPLDGIDTFDMVDTSMPGDPSSPWDADSAEALTRLYDEPEKSDELYGAEEEPLTDARTPDPESADFDMPMRMSNFPEQIADVDERAAIEASLGGVVDQTWLESKFTEIAERIELTLSEMDPRQPVEEMGHRLQSFEARFDTALQDVATRADLEGLREWSAGSGQSDAHLQRLETIEGTLQDVVARFADSGAMAQFADMDGAAVRGVDPDEIADAAARRIADHLALQGASPDGDAIADVRAMIEDFLRENREGNEQTALMLDTIQQAMIRILDRLDALETGNGYADSGISSETDHHQAAFGSDLIDEELEQSTADELATAAEGWVEPGTPSFGSDDDIQLTARESHVAVGTGDDAAFADDAFEDEVEAEVTIQNRANGHGGGVEQNVDGDAAVALAGSRIEQPAESDGGEPLSGSAPQPPAAPVRARLSPDLLSEHSDQITIPAASATVSRAAIDKMRQNFIADAQQAKAHAALAAARPQQTAAQSKTAQAKPARRSVLDNLKSKAVSGDAPKGFFAGKTRRLLIGALLAVAVIQGAVFMLPKSDPAEPVAPAAVSDPAANSPEAPTQSKLDKSSSIVPGDGFGPGVEDGVVYNDLRLASAEAQQSADGAIDLPMGIVLQQTTASEWTKPGRPINMGKAATVHTIAHQPDAPVTQSSTRQGRIISVANAKSSTTGLELPPLTVGPNSLRQAAADGDPSAQFEVGTRLSEGKGTKQDFKKAALWFKRSAGQGFAQAQYRLGTLYERGLGVTRDTNRAQIWYLRAAEQGNVRAMHNVAVLSAGQESGKTDYARAARWFMKAAEAALADSQFNAGVLYENGLGVAKDLVQAYKWYTLAARTGDKESLKRSQKLRSELPIDQLGEAETAVRSFTPNKVEPLINNARLAGQEWKSRVGS